MGSHTELPLLRSMFWGNPIQQKSELRRALIEKRSQLHPRVSTYKSQLINQTLLNLPEIQSKKNIACYHSIRNEVDLAICMAEWRKQNKSILLPKIINKEMQFYHVQDETQLNKGSFGILEPDENQCELTPVNEIDAYIVPGAAFDLFGYRIGYGGGYYDRYLQKKRSDAIAIGVGYAIQLVSAIHSGEHDLPVDMVLTDEMKNGNLIRPTHSFFQSSSPNETQKLAAKLVELGITNEPVIALHGDLGTGKTEFVKGLASACGSTHTVSSPTYVFIHEYEGNNPLRHIDCYRIDELTAQDSEFWHESITASDRCVVIEWAEKIGGILPNNTVHIYGIREDGDTRTWNLFTAYKNQQRLHNI